VETTRRAPRGKRRPQRAVPQSVRRSGKPLFFGWGAHLTHHEREQVKERLAAGIGVVIALAVIGILANGWYQQNVARPAAIAARNNQVLATVGSYPIRRGWYNKVKAYRTSLLTGELNTFQSQLAQLQAGKSARDKAEAAQLSSLVSQLQSQQSSLPSDTLNSLIDTQVVKQKGPSAGLKISAKAERKYLHKLIYGSQFGGPVLFDETAKKYGMTVSQLKGLLLGDYLQQKMQTLLAAKVKQTELEAEARHILVKTRSLALRIQHKLEAGANFAKLAEKYSTDTGSAKNGGSLGWFPQGQMVAPFNQAAFHQPIGAITIVHSQFGYHVLQVLKRAKRPISLTQLQTNRQQALQTWLTKESKGLVHQYYHPPAAIPAGLSGLPTSNGSTTIPGGATSTGTSPTGGTGATGTTGTTGSTGSSGAGTTGTSSSGSSSGHK